MAKKRLPFAVEALPVPRDWCKGAWHKAFNAMDSRIYHESGNDAAKSRAARDAGVTWVRALTLWRKYPANLARRTLLENEEDEEEEAKEAEMVGFCFAWLLGYG